jgi:hypothetical protein
MMASRQSKVQPALGEKATTCSPADEDLFGDAGAECPTKDRMEPARQQKAPSTEAGSVD